MTILLDDEMMTNMRVSYALRWVPRANMATLLPCPVSPQPGDVALAKLEKSARTRLSNWQTAGGALCMRETFSRWCSETATRRCNSKATRAQMEIPALLLMGKLTPRWQETSVASVRMARNKFDVGLTLLLLADEQLNRSQNQKTILEIFGKRGIQPAPSFRHGRHGELYLDTQMAHQRCAVGKVESRIEGEGETQC